MCLMSSSFAPTSVPAGAGKRSFCRSDHPIGASQRSAMAPASGRQSEVGKFPANRTTSFPGARCVGAGNGLPSRLKRVGARMRQSGLHTFKRVNRHDAVVFSAVSGVGSKGSWAASPLRNLSAITMLPPARDPAPGRLTPCPFPSTRSGVYAEAEFAEFGVPLFHRRDDGAPQGLPRRQSFGSQFHRWQGTPPGQLGLVSPPVDTGLNAA